MNKYFAISVFILFAGAVNAQQWRTADSTEVLALMSRVTDYYRSSDFVLSYEKLFYLNEGDTLFSKDAGRLMKGPGNSYYSAGTNDMVVQNNRIKLIVSDTNTTIYLSEPDSVFNPVPLASLAGTIRNYTFQVREEGNKLSLKVFPKLDPAISIMQLDIESGKFISALRIDYKPNNYILRSLNDESIERPVMLITYSTPEQLTVSDKLLLDPARYATVTTTDTHGNNAYKNYSITDLRRPATTKINGK